MDDQENHLRKMPAKSRAVRAIPKASKGHFVGELVFNRGDHPQRLGFASLHEYRAALCLIYRPDFLDLEEQLAPLYFSLPNGKPSKHFFDFRLTQKGGRRICISVKREWVANTYKYRSLIKCVQEAACGNICDAVITITERNIHPIRLQHAELFHAARDPEPELDQDIIAKLRKHTGPVSINEFLTESKIGGKGFFSVARAIRFGHAKLFSFENITGKALIVGCEAA